MPWTHEKPYVMQSFTSDHTEPDELFHATEAEQIAAFGRDRQGGIYIRILRGLGESTDPNSWEILEEWPVD
jgi:hypothetical protein